MRFTIERIRTLLVTAGVLLIAAIAIFLTAGKWRRSFNRRDIPKRLGIDIEQEANGVTYTQAHGGHTVFKIHASRVIELKNDHATLHDVQIEIYGQQNGSAGDHAAGRVVDRVIDRIHGNEFDYDNKTGTATATGPVEIMLERPAAAAAQKPGAKMKQPAQNEIHVQTSGLVFNQQTGMATTTERVEFSTAQANGSAIGASYDSDRDLLVLDHDVELAVRPTATRGRAAAAVQVHAQHAAFDRGAQIIYLTGAAATTNGEHATAAQAQVVVRDDGTVENLDVSGGCTLATAAGSHLAAPTAAMQFDNRNRPVRGHFAGGVTLNSANAGRALSGSSPTMDVAFDATGQVRHVHLERGVALDSREAGEPVVGAQTASLELTRTWRSPVADLDFREAGAGKVEPAAIHGTGGVAVTSESSRGNSRLAADDVAGEFGPGATLTSMTGTGHARLEQTTDNSAHQTATGDQLQAHFAPANAASAARGNGGPAGAIDGGAQIQSAELDGHVSLEQQPAQKPGAPPEPSMRATAAHAEFESAGQSLHLTGAPRVSDGGMELAADRIDISQDAGEAFAHGNVKATWIESTSGQRAAAHPVSSNPVSLGGRGPAHAIATEAEFHQATGKATFRGRARLWQQDNSISGPLIVLNREQQTLVARTSNTAEPVTVVLVSAAAPQNAAAPRPARANRGSSPAAPEVVRVRGGDLWYSGTERKAILRAGPLAAVTAQSGAVESRSNQVDLFLAPAGAALSSGGGAVPAEVERMVAGGHVVLTSQGRRGTGEQLTYISRTGEYMLMGTAAAPPRLTDPDRGSVTGAALIFNSRNDSVSIEGHGQETKTDTTAPR